MDNNMKYDFNDLIIEPAIISKIESRKDISYYTNNNKLPLMTAPMDTVINKKNFKYFIDLKYTVVFPRTIKFKDILDMYDDGDPFLLEIIKNHFFSISLNEFKDICNENYQDLLPKNILVDIANGHMKIIKDLAIKFKEKYPYKILMIGNIANPETYKYYAESQVVDMIRIGIGAGNACLTTKSTSIGYPMASLIYDTYQIKKNFEKENPNKKAPLIIADGGMKEYADIIKGLGLGADQIMIGSLLNKSMESAGDNFLWGIKLPYNLSKFLYLKGFPIKKYFRGMSTKEVQIAMGKDKKNLNTSEGVIRYRKVEYLLNKWTENLIDYLKSAMSYTNSENLKNFIGQIKFNLITQNAYNRFNK